MGRGRFTRAELPRRAVSFHRSTSSAGLGAFPVAAWDVESCAILLQWSSAVIPIASVLRLGGRAIRKVLAAQPEVNDPDPTSFSSCIASTFEVGYLLDNAVFAGGFAFWIPRAEPGCPPGVCSPSQQALMNGPCL